MLLLSSAGWGQAPIFLPGIEGHLTAPPDTHLPLLTKRALEMSLDQAKEETKVDFAVLYLSAPPTAPLTAVAQKALETWNIGKDQANGGVMLVVSPDARDCDFAQTAGQPLSLRSIVRVKQALQPGNRPARAADALASVIERTRRILRQGREVKVVGMPLARRPERAGRYALGSVVVVLLALFLTWKKPVS